MLNPQFAPGMRVEIRNAEWRVKSIAPSSDGGWLLAREGLSELVQVWEALFLTNLVAITLAQFSKGQLLKTLLAGDLAHHLPQEFCCLMDRWASCVAT